MTDGNQPAITATDYQSALDFLFGRLDYERTPQRAKSIQDFKLSRMQRLLEALGNPQQQIPAVHIAGTKGKGSTATMVARILEAAGYRTGLFTSPHMIRFEERMTVNGCQPTPAELVELVGRLQRVVASLEGDEELRNPTFFELSTALGWMFFQQQRVDFAVLEVGLGGRLDSTNICRPIATAITSISRDHTRLLGETLEEIAREKAGIIKPRVPVFVGNLSAGPLEVVTDVAAQNIAKRYALGQEFFARWSIGDPQPYRRPPRYMISVSTQFGEIHNALVGMPGEHQARNASLAAAIALWMKAIGNSISNDAIRYGLLHAVSPLRTEVIGEAPLVIVDAAHNEASIAALCATLEQVHARRRIVIFGASKDKEVPPMLALAGGCADELILTRYLNNPRALPIAELEEMARTHVTCSCHSADSPAAAFALARKLSHPDDLICTTGSFFLAAEMRQHVLSGQQSPLEHDA